MRKDNGQMYAVNTYEQIEKREWELNERHIIVLLFVRPSLPGADKVIEEFNYIHHNAGRYCSVYAVGYSDICDNTAYPDFRPVKGTCQKEWYYSDQAFVDFKEILERRLKWRYSGEIELLILQSNPEGKSILNFDNYLAVDVNYGIRNEYIESFPRFMESLIRGSKKEVESVELTKKIRRCRLKEIAFGAIEECKKIPKPVRSIIKDRLFYKTARSYS